MIDNESVSLIVSTSLQSIQKKQMFILNFSCCLCKYIEFALSNVTEILNVTVSAVFLETLIWKHLWINSALPRSQF